MLKIYNQKWQNYYVKLLWNSPLIIPKEDNEENKRTRMEAKAIIASLIAMSTQTNMYYKIP